jgi:two-component system nitrate/nitrite response regulator NarL
MFGPPKVATLKSPPALVRTRVGVCSDYCQSLRLRETHRGFPGGESMFHPGQRPLGAPIVENLGGFYGVFSVGGINKETETPRLKTWNAGIVLSRWGVCGLSGLPYSSKTLKPSSVVSQDARTIPLDSKLARSWDSFHAGFAPSPDGRTGDPTRPASTNPIHSYKLMSNRIKILVADDHPVVRKGIITCLAKQETVEIIGEAADGREAVRKARELKPDLILMDINMPHMSGLAVTELLRRELPQIKVLVLSSSNTNDQVTRIIQSGAQGYVLKDAPMDELMRAIDSIQRGEAYFSADVARVALNQFVRGQTEAANTPQLTNREREVLAQIADGLSNKEIASQLGVGVRTVETHRERIMRKLDIHNVAGLTKFAIAKGLVSLEMRVMV